MGDLTKSFVGGWEPVGVSSAETEAAKAAFENFYGYSEELSSSRWEARCTLGLGKPALVVLPQTRWDTVLKKHVRSAMADKIIEGLKKAFPLGSIDVGSTTGNTSVVVYSTSERAVVVRFLKTLLGVERKVDDDGGEKITFPPKK